MKEKTFVIKDASNRHVAETVVPIGKEDRYIALELRRDEELLALIEKDGLLNIKQFSIPTHDIITKPRKWRVSHDIYKNEPKIAEVNGKLFRWRENYELKIDSTSPELLLILFTFVIAVDREAPSLVGDVFKRIEF